MQTFVKLSLWDLYHLLSAAHSGKKPGVVMQRLVSGLSPKEKKAILNQDFSELNLQVRVHNCLENAGFKTIGDIVRFKHQSKKFLSIKGFGEKSFDELAEALLRVGIDLDECWPGYQNWYTDKKYL